MSESGHVPSRDETIHAFRDRTEGGVAVVLSDGDSVGRIVIPQALHDQIGEMLGLPKIGENG